MKDDDWDRVDELMTPALDLLEPGAPLEFLRFRDDLVTSRMPSDADLARWTAGGWLAWCERELAGALEVYELDLAARDALRMAIHLIRRFGAGAPLTVAIAELQVAERGIRERWLRDAMARHGLSVDGVGAGWADLVAWIQDARPSVLPFPDWFALRATPEKQALELWFTGISGRVFDVCTEVVGADASPAARPWLQLASLALVGAVPSLGLLLASHTEPRRLLPEEERLFEAVTRKQAADDLVGVIPKIEEGRAARGDYVGARLLREVIRQVRSRRRDK
jgi:hypothetical protein